MKLKHLITDESVSLEAKLNALAKSIQQLQRQPASVATHTMPPIPISQCTEVPAEDGTVMKFMFPADGIIKRAAIFVEQMPVDDKGRAVSMVEVDARFYNASGATKQSFEVYRKPLVMELEVPVKAGDRLRVSLREGVVAKGVWCAFLYDIAQKHHAITQVLVEELRALEEEADATDEVSGEG
jgi:hypothetical protein